jgi:hypothetical protein
VRLVSKLGIDATESARSQAASSAIVNCRAEVVGAVMKHWASMTAGAEMNAPSEADREALPRINQLSRPRW